MNDAEMRLWTEIEALNTRIALDRVALGRRFAELKTLYSERNSGGRRLTSGHGTFEFEIKARGYKPRTVREWIADYEASLTGGQSASAKRKTRRAAIAVEMKVNATYSKLPAKAELPAMSDKKLGQALSNVFAALSGLESGLEYLRVDTRDVLLSDQERENYLDTALRFERQLQILIKKLEGTK